MKKIKLEEVFKLSGIPSYTFVEPKEYNKLLVSLRTPGRGVVIEGPSGIGKTTAVYQALERLGLNNNVTTLSARKKGDIELIEALRDFQNVGTVLVDDFHRLSDDTKASIADLLKIFADEEREDSKLIIIGINRSGERLIKFGDDLNTRIDVIRFETNPNERVEKLISLGEERLNIYLSTKQDIVDAAAGGFYLAQFLCHETCLQQGIFEEQDEGVEVSISFEVVRQSILDNLERRFFEKAATFAKGTRLRREGRAPYLHILKWLADSKEWSIQLQNEILRHSELKGSVSQVVEKGYLEQVIKDKEKNLFGIFHYESEGQILSVEDPQFIFYLRNIQWNIFAARVGYINVHFDSRYDFALSFAGTDRDYADKLFKLLQEREFEVFYDKNEQHRILAESLEEYLAPIYKTEAKYIVCFLGKDYPQRLWTKFESDQFKARFGDGSVIPIWFKDDPASMFDDSRKVGGFILDTDEDIDSQLDEIAETLTKKIADRITEKQLELSLNITDE
ncbi:MAG: TIR domain-containing protein [Synechococcales bacterium]|nr:TIR domain-containing protein [Synechococcales bacterium]